MRWLLLLPLRPFVLLAAAASLLLNLAMLVPSIYTLQVFDRVFSSRSVETLVVLSALTVLALLFAYGMDVARSRSLATAGRILELALAPRLLEQSLERSAASGHAADGERMRDIARLRAFLGGTGVRALFDAPWLPIYLFVIGLMHPVLGVAAGVGGLVLAIVALVTERLTHDASEVTMRRSRAVGRLTSSLLRQAESLVAMGMVQGAMTSWRVGHESMVQEQARLAAVGVRVAALGRVLRQAVQISVLGIGAWLVVDTGASPGIMVAATILLGRALQPVEQLIGGWRQLVEARSAWRRLSAPGAIAGTTTRMRLPAPAGKLELERVVFTHDASRPALIKGVSFAIEAGESLGIVGPSGSGKSTLIRLLLGVWPARGGAVRLDGVDISQWDRTDLGRHVGYQPQDGVLFDGTIAQNISRLGPRDDIKVIEAAHAAHAHHMILRLPDGYDTLVGERGIQLSGGQRQRICLARALYGRPALVVLDEPDAHLDAEGEKALRQALQKLKARGASVVVVGHRVGLMAELDKIVSLTDGVVQAIGPAAAMLSQMRAGNVHALPRGVAS